MNPRQILAGLLSVLLLLFTGCSRSPSTEGPTSGSAGGGWLRFFWGAMPLRL